MSYIFETEEQILAFATAGNRIPRAQIDGYGNVSILGPSLTAPTPATSDNSTKVATTAWVQAQGYGSSGGLTPTAKTTTYTAAAGDLILGNASGGAFTVTLPTGQANGARIGVLKSDTGGNAVTVSRGGSDTIHGLTSGGQTSFNVRGEGDLYVLVYDGTSVWYVLTRQLSPSVSYVYASTAGQSFTSGSEVGIQFDTQLSDPDSLWSGTHNTRITVKKPGKYVFIGGGVWNNLASGRHYLNLWKNGISTGTFLNQDGGVWGGSGSNGFDALNASATVDMAAGDYVELSASQNSGNPGTFLASGLTSPSLQAIRISD